MYTSLSRLIYKGTALAIIQNETQRGKRMKTTEKSISKLWEDFKLPNTSVTGIGKNGGGQGT